MKIPRNQREKMQLARKLRRAMLRERAEIRTLVKTKRAAQLLQGIAPHFILPGAVLRDRAQKAWNRAKDYDPDAEYVDYEATMVSRPETCRECGQRMDDERELSIVHRVSVERGGSHTPDNIEVLHIKCHRAVVAKMKKIDKLIPRPKTSWRGWSEKKVALTRNERKLRQFDDDQLHAAQLRATLEEWKARAAEKEKEGKA
jgi:5-methylcytosine-specific restriction endonuclease McrA